MSNKKYKNKLCAYCAQRQSVVGDHVFAREFFVPSQRSNLPKAPACHQCNNDKSKLEHYLTAILPFGGRHETAKENLVTLVPARLAKNARLNRCLVSNKSRVWSKEGKLYEATIAMPINAESIEQLFAFIARGLVWHYWKTYFTDEHLIEVFLLTDFGSQFFEQRFFKLNAAQRVRANLGNGTVCYEGVQGMGCPQITVWRFMIYGGLVLFGDPKSPRDTCTEIAVLTGPRRTFRIAELRYQLGLRPNEVIHSTANRTGGR